MLVTVGGGAVVIPGVSLVVGLVESGFGLGVVFGEDVKMEVNFFGSSSDVLVLSDSTVTDSVDDVVLFSLTTSSNCSASKRSLSSRATAVTEPCPVLPTSLSRCSSTALRSSITKLSWASGSSFPTAAELARPSATLIPPPLPSDTCTAGLEEELASDERLVMPPVLLTDRAEAKDAGEFRGSAELTDDSGEESPDAPGKTRNLALENINRQSDSSYLYTKRF